MKPEKFGDMEYGFKNEVPSVGAIASAIPQDCEEAEHLLGMYVKWLFGEIRTAEDVLVWLKSHPHALEWAIDEGIVGWVEETYKVGDWVVVDGSPEQYLFQSVDDNHMVLSNPTTGRRHGNCFFVNNNLKIKRSEIPHLCGKSLEKIPAPEIIF
jgi:hypothetical protein